MKMWKKLRERSTGERGERGDIERDEDQKREERGS